MPTTGTSTQNVPDPIFFFSIVELQVEGILFRLPNYVCEQSKVLQDKIAAQQPCVLEDVTAAEFRDFLSCLIGPFLNHLKATESKERIPEDIRIREMKRWVNALKLSTLWGFRIIRRMAIDKINLMNDPPLKLAVGCKYDAPWFLPGALRDLADTKVMTPLNKEDYEILGIDLAIKVAQYREQWICNAPAETKKKEDYHRKLVEEIFGAKFAEDVKKGEAHPYIPLSLFKAPMGLLGRHRAQYCVKA